MTVVRPSFRSIRAQPLSGDAAPHSGINAVRTALISKTGSWTGPTPPVVDFPPGYLSRDEVVLFVAYRLDTGVTHHSAFGVDIIPPSGGWNEAGFYNGDYGFSDVYTLKYSSFHAHVLTKTSVQIPTKYNSGFTIYDLAAVGGIYMLLIVPDIDSWGGSGSEAVEEGQYISDIGPNTRDLDFVSTTTSSTRKLIVAISSELTTGIVGKHPDVSTDPIAGYTYPAKFSANYIIEDSSLHYKYTTLQHESGQIGYPVPSGDYSSMVETMAFNVMSGLTPVRAAATSIPGDVKVRRV